ncbi:MAG: LTA synthase family protein [Sphingopyxis sp.]|uniref:sulfatase-like hydrolase/transferase n=1 Tax=Sphingopyxis sp. TaxID=1908224 RepID=UPI003D80B44C
MAQDGDDLRAPLRRAGWPAAAAALLLFALGYGIANRFQLVHGVAYRFAAGDGDGAAIALAFMAFQALVLFAALVLVPRRWAVPLIVLAGASILVNIGYTQIIPELVDGGTLAWMLAEMRQAPHAAGQFAGAFALVGVQVVAALSLFVLARGLARRHRRLPWNAAIGATLVVLLVVPGIVYRHAEVWPEGAERSLYGLGWDLATAPAPPARAAPALKPAAGAATPRHIVWLIDESVAAAPFERLIAPRLADTPHLDFGVAAAMGHCSAPAQVALRSGVDVRRVSPATDLRRTPSIWGYARAAGYRSMMIEGQTAGAPQNLMLPPERALIDAYRPMAGGIDTDLRIAEALNRRMRGTGRTFTFAVLRGVHFQYRDHYPAGAIAADSPVALQYDTALTWSKRDFFARLLAGVDRERVAIVYTSDHGQNLAPGALPHCSRDAAADEFRVPLLTFLPQRLAARYAAAPREGHSASQIFPATLIWMGYDPRGVAARYDDDLTKPTARYVWFGRTVIPIAPGDAISVTAGPDFPGTAPR